MNGCIAGREIAPPPLRPNFPLPCRFPLPVFNLPRVSNYPFCPLLVLLLVLRAGAFFSLESAAEFYVPLMRASGAAKRSRPLFVQRAPIEPSSAIAQGSGTICAVGRRFQTRGDGSFRGGLRHIRALRDTPAPRPVKRRIQRKDQSLQNAAGEISGTKTINALTQASV